MRKPSRYIRINAIKTDGCNISTQVLTDEDAACVAKSTLSKWMNDEWMMHSGSSIAVAAVHDCASKRNIFYRAEDISFISFKRLRSITEGSAQ